MVNTRNRLTSVVRVFNGSSLPFKGVPLAWPGKSWRRAKGRATQGPVGALLDPGGLY